MAAATIPRPHVFTLLPLCLCRDPRPIRKAPPPPRGNSLFLGEAPRAGPRAVKRGDTWALLFFLLGRMEGQNLKQRKASFGKASVHPGIKEAFLLLGSSPCPDSLLGPLPEGPNIHGSQLTTRPRGWSLHFTGPTGWALPTAFRAGGHEADSH